MSEQVGEQVYRRGVGAVLDINGGTQAMHRLFGNLPGSHGVPIDPSLLHVTLVDSLETALNVQSESDLIVLRNAGRAMFDYLGALPLKGAVLWPKEPRLEKFGHYLGISVDPDSFIGDVRGRLGEIVKAEMGRTLNDKKFVPHMAVTSLRRARVKGVNNETNDQLRMPRNIHVNGYSVGQKTYTAATRSRKQRQVYVNKSSNRP
jgi:hypothetical protein